MAGKRIEANVELEAILQPGVEPVEPNLQALRAAPAQGRDALYGLQQKIGGQPYWLGGSDQTPPGWRLLLQLPDGLLVEGDPVPLDSNMNRLLLCVRRSVGHKGCVADATLRQVNTL